MKPISLTVVLFLVLARPALAGEGAKDMAVLSIRADTEMSKGLLNTLNEILLSEFHQIGGLNVLGSSDITSMLTLEEQRASLTGCADDSCLAEIGGALGVKWMAATSIGAVGDQYVVSVKILDVSRAKVLSRTSETVPREESGLIAAIRKAARKVTQAVVPPETAGANIPAAHQPAPAGGGGFIDTAPWLTLGLAVVSGATATVLGVLALGDAESARGEVSETAQWKDYSQAAEDKGLAADILFGVAGAAAIGTLILFLTDSKQSPTGPGVSLSPTAGGLLLKVDF